jgi:hypothetical protein
MVSIENTLVLAHIISGEPVLGERYGVAPIAREPELDATAMLEVEQHLVNAEVTLFAIGVYTRVTLLIVLLVIVVCFAFVPVLVAILLLLNVLLAVHKAHAEKVTPYVPITAMNGGKFSLRQTLINRIEHDKYLRYAARAFEAAVLRSM